MLETPITDGSIQADLLSAVSVFTGLPYQAPKYFGSWRLPSANFYLGTLNKPRWIHRFFMKHLLGWEWQA